MNARQALGRALQWVGALTLLALLGAGLYGLLVLRRGVSTRDTPSALETWAARTARRAAVPDRVKRLQNPVSPTQSLTDGELYSIIQNGIRLTGMPAWGEPGENDRQTWGLVALIRHLPELTAEEEAEMKELNPRSVHEQQEKQLEEEFLNQP